MAARCKDAAGRRIGRLHHHRSAGDVSWPLAIRRCVGGISAGMRCCCADVSCGARAGGSPSLVTAFSQRTLSNAERLRCNCMVGARPPPVRRMRGASMRLTIFDHNTVLRRARALPLSWRTNGIGCDVSVLMCAAGADASHPLRVHGVPCHPRSRSCRSANRRLPALLAHLRPPVLPGSVGPVRRHGWPLARRSRSLPAAILP